MFSKNLPENKKNDLRNYLETDYKILTGEVNVEKLRLEDILEIVEYGWDRNDLQRMLDAQDYRSIGCLAAWIRECGECDHGYMVEDGNYIEGAFGRCC